MSRTIDEVVALHIGGLALEMCKAIKRSGDLQEDLEKLKKAAPPKEEPEEPAPVA